MSQRQLIDDAMHVAELDSLRKLGELTGIDYSDLSRWHNDEKVMSAEGAMVLAMITGRNVAKTVADMRLPKAKKPALAKWLKKISSAAAIAIALWLAPHIANAKSEIVHNTAKCNFTYSVQSIHSRKN